MRHWLHLATRNWRVRPGRAVAATVAIALGVGTVVSITGFYESVRRSISDRVVSRWLGKSHLSVEPPLGHWGRLDASLAEVIADMPGVAHVSVRLKRRMLFVDRGGSGGSRPDPAGPSPSPEEVDAIGIRPETEYLFRDYAGLVGRRIHASESGVAVIEASLAHKHGVTLGDTIVLSASVGGREAALEIIGMFEARRVAKFQRPNVIVPLSDLQRVRNEPDRITVIDVMLHDPSVSSVQRAAQAIQERVTAQGHNARVTSAAARLKQLQEAERITHLILVMVAFVAMLTAFFIILTTMSMGIIERIGQLGILRCVGMTRRQLAVLVMLELLPLGGVGVILGLPIGLGITRIGAALIPEYVQGVAVSWWGIGLAVAGGAVTTIVGAVVLVFQVNRVTPLSAANPEAQPTRLWITAIAAVAGVGLLLAHDELVKRTPETMWLEYPAVSLAGVVSVYAGYVLLAPGLVLLAGTAVVTVVAPVLRLRHRLARDQISRAPWRSAGVCWMLMVGLSLIVYIGVRGESLIAAWDFPKKLPGSFVWSWNKVPLTSREMVAALPGVGDFTVVDDFLCLLGKGEESTSIVEGMKKKTQVMRECTFVAGELNKFLEMTKLSFLEGDSDEALAKLRRGGAIILPPEAAHTLGLTVGDRVRIRAGAREATFEVAGIVQSPALDIAVTYFQADSYMMRAAAGSVLGTIADAQKYFGLDTISMFLLNIDLPPATYPSEFKQDKPPPRQTRSIWRFMLDWADRLPNERAVLAAAAPVLEQRLAPDPRAGPSPGRPPRLDNATKDATQRFRIALDFVSESWDELSPQQRWEMFREQLVLRKVASRLNRPLAIVGSVRRLKQQIDQDVREMCLLMSAMPAVALIVAALGVANLMMVSVSVRTRQIAVLRAVGATKSQVVRLVLAEAVTLGVVGCGMGVLLGMHAARSSNVVTEKLVGLPLTFVMPWGQVAMGVLLTVLVSILAGIGPARRAARNNIVDAMQAG